MPWRWPCVHNFYHSTKLFCQYAKLLTFFRLRQLRFKMSVTYTRELLRAARIALRISHDEMAARSGVSRPTLTKIELTDEGVGTRSIEKVQTALERAGIEFLPPMPGTGPGFRLPEKARD